MAQYKTTRHDQKSSVLVKWYVGLDFNKTFIPILKLASIKILLTITLTSKTVRQLDVNNVFLNVILQVEIFIEQHPRFVNTKSHYLVYKLNKALYGLKQALQDQFQKLHFWFFFNLIKLIVAHQNYIKSFHICPCIYGWYIDYRQ